MDKPSPAPAVQESFIARGGLWVIAQFWLMAFILVGAPLWGSWEKGSWTIRIIALVCIILGASFGVSGVRGLGAQRTPMPKPVSGGQLVQTGIYGLVRHPLYASLIWLGFGWGLLFTSTPSIIAALIQVIFLDLKSRQEERWLGASFPDYTLYAARVKRFFPGVY